MTTVPTSPAEARQQMRDAAAAIEATHAQMLVTLQRLANDPSDPAYDADFANGPQGGAYMFLNVAYAEMWTIIAALRTGLSLLPEEPTS